MNVEVLVTTMNQGDTALYRKMNLSTDAVFANQGSRTEYLEEVINGRTVKTISTETRGVGVNRNLALMYASGDILLMSDDDMVYNPGYEAEIVKAFEVLPDADMILFEGDIVRHGQVIKRISSKTKRRRWYNSMKYPTWLFAVRRSSLEKSGIAFSVLYGGGTKFSCGEDSKFLLDCMKYGMKVYSYEYNLGKNINDTSTWFQGFNEKYFYDKGVLFKNMFHGIAPLMNLYIALRIKDDRTVSMRRRLKLLKAGRKGFAQMLTYEEYIKSCHRDGA